MKALIKILATLRHFLKRAWRFTVDDVWDVDPGSLPFVHGAGNRIVRVVNMVVRGFREDECPMQAAALTFNTLMAIVPVLALSLAMARGLGNEAEAKARIRDIVSEWTQSFSAGTVPTEVHETEPSEGPEAGTPLPEPATGPAAGSSLAQEIDRLVVVGFEKVEKVSFAALGGVGLAILIWMVVSVLGRVEGAFNRVWGVSQGRSLWRKFTDYLSVLLILPLLAVLASSLPVADFATRYLEPNAAEFVRALLGSGFLKSVMVVVMTTLCFGFVIMFMPNTRVLGTPGLVGGLVTALLFIAWMWVCARLQVGAARFGRIYGSFAIVPILLLWVYVSWEIVLFGAEVAFATQNCATYRMERKAHDASLQSRAMLALSLVIETARTMHRAGTNRFNLTEFANNRRVPVRFVNSVVRELEAAGLMGELTRAGGDFVLLKSPTDLTVKHVLDAVMQTGVRPAALGLDGLEPAIAEVVGRADAGLEQSVGGITIQSLLACG